MIHSTLIVEDLADTRQWLVELTREAFPQTTVFEAGDIGAALELIRARAFALALIDLKLPDGNGLEVVRELNREHPETLCIVATVLGEDAQVVAALSAGAHGFLLKEQERSLLIRQLQQAAQGVPALSPSIARRIMEHFRRTGPAYKPEKALTSRESEVLGLIARGLQVSDAACALGITNGTVATHIKSIYRKLGVCSRAEATLHAMRLGLV